MAFRIPIVEQDGAVTTDPNPVLDAPSMPSRNVEAPPHPNDASGILQESPAPQPEQDDLEQDGSLNNGPPNTLIDMVNETYQMCPPQTDTEQMVNQPADSPTIEDTATVLSQPTQQIPPVQPLIQPPEIQAPVAPQMPPTQPQPLNMQVSMPVEILGGQGQGHWDAPRFNPYRRPSRRMARGFMIPTYEDGTPCGFSVDLLFNFV